MKIIFFILLSLCLGSLKAAEREIPVRVAVVKLAPIQEEISLTGMITAQRISNLSSRVDAMVVKVLVEAGNFVKQGDDLVVLDSALARYDMKRTAASLEEAKAELRESIRRRDEFSKLIEKKYMAKTAFEEAVSNVRIKSAIVKRIEANHKRNKELLDQHKIKAPFGGVISKKLIETGQWLKVGDNVLELVDINHLRVEVLTPQRYYSRLQQGAQVTIFPDALPGKEIKATITHKIPVANATAHTFPVHIEIENNDQLVTPGMTTWVVFQVSSGQTNQSVLLAPRDAIVKNNTQWDSVWVTKQGQQGHTVYPVAVKTGRVYKGDIEILEGNIDPGMQVVIRGNEILKSGQSVKISP